MVSVVFHVPTTDNEGNAFHPVLISWLMNMVIQRVGGVTVLYGEGAWLHEDELYREPVMRVMAGVSEVDLEGFVQWIEDQLKTEFEQISVWIEVDGKPSIR